MPYPLGDTRGKPGVFALFHMEFWFPRVVKNPKPVLEEHDADSRTVEVCSFRESVAIYPGLLELGYITSSLLKQLVDAGPERA